MELRVAHVRLLFLSVLGLYLLQGLIVLRWKEPYPALMLPRFGGTFADASGTYSSKSVHVVVEFRDGAPARITPRTLLDTVPSGTVMPIMRRVFAAEGDRKPPVLSARRPRTPPATDPDLQAWLRRRLAGLFPARDAVRVTFAWYQDTYRLAPAGVERSQRAASRVTVELSDGS